MLKGEFALSQINEGVFLLKHCETVAFLFYSIIIGFGSGVWGVFACAVIKTI